MGRQRRNPPGFYLCTSGGTFMEPFIANLLGRITDDAPPTPDIQWTRPTALQVAVDIAPGMKQLRGLLADAAAGTWTPGTLYTIGDKVFMVATSSRREMARARDRRRRRQAHRVRHSKGR